MTHWKDITEKYPLAFKVWWEWIINNDELCDYDIEQLENRVLFQDLSKFQYFNEGSFYEFFDLHEIMIGINIDYTRQGYGMSGFQYEIGDFRLNQDANCNCKTIRSELYSTRKEATQDTFIKAFELLEARLKVETNPK